jgi:hypothetical protein
MGRFYNNVVGTKVTQFTLVTRRDASNTCNHLQTHNECLKPFRVFV